MRASRRLVAAAAGLRAARVVPGVERVPARARVHSVRVVHREPGTHQAVDIVDLGALDVRGAEVVHEDVDAAGLDHKIFCAPVVVESHAVLHARAAAAADEDAEGQLGVAFLL